jgi:hypothetical protein
MLESTEPRPGRAPPSRGVGSADVERAADSLLRSGERPTIEKIRAYLGAGSPNTINPLLDTWWKRLAARLDSGPAALHRLPESVAHVAEALWMQALDEGRQRAQLELKSTQRSAVEQQQALEVRSHVLSLREGELDARLRDRENTIAELNMQLRELRLMLRKQQVTRDAQGQRITSLEEQLSARRLPGPTATRMRTRATPRTRPAAPMEPKARRNKTNARKKSTPKTPTRNRRR